MFFYGTDLFKERSGVVLTLQLSISKSNFVLNSQTTNNGKVAETIQNVLDITRFSSLNKLILVTVYAIRFVNNLKGTLKNNNKNFLLENMLTTEFVDQGTKQGI